MAAYVDTASWWWRGSRWCHLTADTLEELHAFALLIKLRREWFQDGERPHYDMIDWRRATAVKLGAIEVRPRELLARAKALARAGRTA